MMGLALAQVIATLVGALIMLALRVRLPGPLLVTTAWLLGTGALAAERLLLALAGVQWSPVVLAAPWVALGMVMGRRVLGAGRPRSPSTGSGRRLALSHRGREEYSVTQEGVLARYIDVVMVGVILAWVAAYWWQATNEPLAGWDAWAFWFLKGRAFFQAEGFPTAFFADPRFPPYAHLDYPLFVPLTIAGAYAWTGDNELLMKGWWPLLGGAALVTMYWGLAGLHGRVARACGLVLLLALPELSAHAGGTYVGYADLPLAVLMLYTGIFLYRWWREPSGGLLVLAVSFAAMAGFTKNEGLSVAVLVPALVIGKQAVLRQFDVRATVGALAGWVLLIVSWQVKRASLGIAPEFSPTLGAIQAGLPERGDAIIAAFIGLAGDPARFGLLWPVAPLLGVAALVFAPRRWLVSLPLVALVAGHLAAAGLAYVVSPNDIGWHLATSADRVLFQVTPLVVLIATVWVGALVEDEGSGQEPRPTRELVQ